MTQHSHPAYERIPAHEPKPPHQIQKVRHEIQHRYPIVTQVESLSPSFIRILLEGDDLVGLPSMSFDDHIKVFVPDGQGNEVNRDYTPRAFNPEAGILELEFVVHADGAASDWAQQVKIGDQAHLAGPRGSMIIPMDYDWYWLIGDPTALPAIHRRIEELPLDAHITVIAQVDHPEDQHQMMASTSSRQVHWVSSLEALLDQVQQLDLPQGDGFVWGAGEGHTMKQLRQMVVTEKGHPSADTRISAYWKTGATDLDDENPS